ncbi:type II toxin-antitoxin system VapC family toxin [Sphingomonas sp. S1-29]|uniref:type II toxin-antitoxin system VapC family toxin n=1 Tax=Sphingomonas sp. S1-29 TaxID=2991074 RepID=UPI00223F47AB|nr:type II toxin-antitoxin system VapC family toxin [Sphingomonas sp. S1-29]UZK69076.1 type II toxin-antitoxin system VapC family toxin [Sphingomonas sp. S1-29]
MIAIDTSAILAIVLREPEAETFGALIQAHRRVFIGAPTLFELRMVTLGKFPEPVRAAVDALALAAPIETIAFTAEHHLVALDAFDRYGKGRHPASLNMGDCLSYAIAKIADCPLLFKGNDFGLTDIARVA